MKEWFNGARFDRRHVRLGLDDADRLALGQAPHRTPHSPTGRTERTAATAPWAGRSPPVRTQRDQEHRDEGHRLAEVHILEAVERHVGHHGQAGEQARPQTPSRAGAADVDVRVGHHQDEADHQRRRGRAGQTLEEALVDHFDIGVEARQAQCGAGAVDEGGDPAQLAQAAQRPFIDHQRRRGAEGHHVGQAVVLGAELDWVLVRRATRPSRPSSTMAMKTAQQAWSNAGSSP
jgi:hypothetical protein